MGDIDFLVPEKDYRLTIKLLKGADYSTFEGSPVYFDVESLKHYPRLSKPGFPADLEVHRLLTEHPLSWFNAAMVEQGKKPVKALSGCFVPSDRHKIIHNFIHSQISHGGHASGIISFRDLYDLFLLSKRTPLAQVLPDIQAKNRGFAYFAFATKALGLPETFFQGSNFYSRMFILKHDLNYSSSAYYHIHRTTLYLYQRIFVGYIRQMFRSIYARKVRQSVINRLSNPQWYRAHFQSYIDFFTGR